MNHSIRQALDTLFKPRSVAIVGISSEPGSPGLGGNVLRHLHVNGFQGSIYPVNPKVSELGGLPCFHSPADLPEDTDVAMLALPAHACVDAARVCAERGVKVAVIIAAGFAEMAIQEGRDRQQALTQIVRETGMRIVGPNCNGVYHAANGISLGFNTAHGERISAGGLALLSHSGALFSTLVWRMRQMNVGLSTFVSVGSEADLNLLDYFEYVLDDAATRVIGLIIDSIEDGDRYRRLAEEAHLRGKRLIALKLGTSERGSQAATAHSSRLAGSAQAYAAFFEQTGTATVQTVEGLVTAAAFLLEEHRPSEETGVAVLASSGGAGTIVADAAARYNVPLTHFTAETQQKLEQLRKFGPVVNPVDMGFSARADPSPIVLDVLVEDPGVSVIILYHYIVPPSAYHAEFVADLCSKKQATGKIFIVLDPGSGLPAEEEVIYRAAHVHVLHDTNVCCEGLAALFASSLHKPSSTVESVSAFSSDVGRHDLAALLTTGRPLTEPESMVLLSAFGLPLVPGRLVGTLEEALAAAEELRWPVVLKGVVEGIAHKSDHGLVALNILDREQLKSAYAQLVEITGSAQQNAILVQSMIAGGLEALVGLTTEVGLGQFLIAGLGGIYTEALNDIVVWSVPVSREDIRRKLLTTQLGRLLTSPRWPTRETLDQVVDIMLQLQQIAIWSRGRISAIDINPLLLRSEGPLAVDALIVPVDK